MLIQLSYVFSSDPMPMGDGLCLKRKGQFMSADAAGGIMHFYEQGNVPALQEEMIL